MDSANDQSIGAELVADEQLVCTPDLVFHGADASYSADPPPEVTIDMCPQMVGCLAAIPAAKRKRHVMSLENKLEVIRRLEAGESILSLSKTFNCGRATIFDIKSQKQSIVAFAEGLRDESVLKTRKTMRIPRKRMSDLFKDSFVDPKLRAERAGSAAAVEERLPPKRTSERIAARGGAHKMDFDAGSDLESPSCSNSGAEKAWEGRVAVEDSEESKRGNCEQENAVAPLDGEQRRCGATDLAEFASFLGRPTPKRKHHVLSIEAKIEILQRLDGGEKGNTLAPLYNIGRATISDIRQKRDSILRFASGLKSEDGLRRRKTMRKARDAALEDAVFMWYVQGAGLGEDVSGPRICDKALELNARLGGPPDFRASSGWLKNFRARHGIRGNAGQGERAAPLAGGGGPESALYLETFLNLLLQEGYHPDDIYSADEALLDWQALPPNSAIPDAGAREPVTLLLCANASWTHALPPLVVGRRRRKDVFGHGVSCFPASYRRRRGGRLDAGAFMGWFANEFASSVRERRRGRTGGRVLLLLDCAPCHPAADMLNRVDEGFRAVLLPAHLAAGGHPAVQGAAADLKRLFRMSLLRRLSSAQDAGEVAELAAGLTLKECCHVLADVWSGMSDQYRKAAADRRWFRPEHPASPTQEHVQEALDLIAQVPGFENCSMSDAFEWLNVDAEDPGTKVLTDDEIVAFVKAEEDSSSEEEEDRREAKDPPKPAPRKAAAPPAAQAAIAWRAERSPHAEAYRAFETAMHWCERQADTTAEELLQLKRLRDLAVRKLWAATGGTASFARAST